MAEGPRHTTIHLLRHGESVANVEHIFANGRVDLPLTPLGRAQAAQGATWLAARGVEHVFSAPLRRAQETAALIAAQLQIEWSVLRDLDEVRVGDLDGRRDDASWAAYDAVIARWRAGEREAAFPGGETYGAAYDRFAAALQEIASRSPGATVAAVTHGAIQLTVLPRLCAALVEQLDRAGAPWALANAAITTLEVTDGAIACAAWSFTGHLMESAS